MAEVEAGRNQLNELSAALEAKDPDFKAKMKIMQPALKGMAKTIHPQLWLNSVADMYRAAGESLAEARPTPKPPGKARQPLGGTSSRGEGAGTPATFESAVMAGLKKVGGSE